MGSKKTKTKQSNRPIYSAQVEGAANAQQGAYDRQLPIINEYSNNLARVSNGLLDQFAEGDPTVGAAQDYIQSTLSSDPQSNPYLDDMVALTGDNTRRAIQTQLGTRGGIGGSVERDIISRALADSELGLRYQDYGNQQQRKMQAAGMAPSIAAAGYLPLDAAMRTGSQGAMLPLQAALANSAGVGGLLGQYQNVEGEQKQNRGLFDFMGLGLQAASLF